MALNNRYSLCRGLWVLLFGHDRVALMTGLHLRSLRIDLIREGAVISEDYFTVAFISRLEVIRKVVRIGEVCIGHTESVEVDLLLCPVVALIVVHLPVDQKFPVVRVIFEITLTGFLALFNDVLVVAIPPGKARAHTEFSAPLLESVAVCFSFRLLKRFIPVLVREYLLSSIAFQEVAEAFVNFIQIVFIVESLIVFFRQSAIYKLQICIFKRTRAAE